MADSFTKTYKNGVTLSNFATTNPVTIANDSYVHVVGNNYAWSLTNQGTIYGLTLTDGGSVTNLLSGTIINDYYPAINISNAVGHVINEGQIAAESPILLYAGGSLTNTQSGTISSLYGAFQIAGQSGTVVNYGLMSGEVGFTSFSGSGTIVNAGTIDTGLGLVFQGVGNNLLVMLPGGEISRANAALGYGPVSANRSASSNTLELSAGRGTIPDFGYRFQGFGTLTVDPSADWTLAGTNTFANNTTLGNSGTIVVDGTLLLSGLLTGLGTIATESGAHNRIVETFYGGLIESLGTDTITAGSQTLNVLAEGNGSLFFSASAGASTVAGGSGVSTLFGSSGAAQFAAASGGGSLLVAGSGNTTLLAAGAGDLLFGGSGQTTSYGAASATAFLVGGSGTSILVAVGAATEFVGGLGPTFVYGGSGNDTIYSGTGQTHATLGGGTDAILIQSGSATFQDGAGSDFYALVNGAGGGSVTIAGFKVGADQIGLFGYGANPIAQNQIVGGNTVLTFSDGTRVTLAGVTNLGDSVL